MCAIAPHALRAWQKWPYWLSSHIFRTVVYGACPCFPGILAGVTSCVVTVRFAECFGGKVWAKILGRSTSRLSAGLDSLGDRLSYVPARD